ncbi:ATP-dependent helicase [Nonomuraea sp. NPDC003709]|uniref:ATP-dependent helicase n=1 Tax=Nonomuraea sp. NPDC003709 TaxID=3154450 RepID=UPI0033AAFAAE
MTFVPSSLAVELAALNDEQREAAQHLGNLVVLAGPGSGKTRTLVVKIGYLLATRQISPWQSIAAITYTRSAAREVTTRLRSLGFTPGRQLISSTLHSWCLGNILRPYGPLVGVPAPGPGSIIDEKSPEWSRIFNSCKDDLRICPDKTALNRARRIRAAGEEDVETAHLLSFARLFEERLLDAGLFDYDLIVSLALRILQENPDVSSMVGARFPWLIVDEYQDLGPVLHTLVLHLHMVEKVKIAAFGDPDQSVMAFAGADPRYLWELAIRQEFREILLSINYRCGQAIIAASQMALDETRSHRADPLRQDAGLVEPVYIGGGLVDHAYAVVQKISALTANGHPLHSIGVLYPNRTLLSHLRGALDVASIPYVLEADERLPQGDMADFIRDCAARAILGPQPSSVKSDRHLDHVSTLTELTHAYNRLRRSSGLPELLINAAGSRLDIALKSSDANDMLAPWVSTLADALELHEIGAASRVRRDQEALESFQDAALRHGLTMGDAAGSVRLGKVVVTTYHSAKGREWKFVLLPGLVDGIMPYRKWSGAHRTHLDPSPKQLAEARRAFYVALTRAKIAAVLFYGRYWETEWGERNTYGVSRIVAEMLRRMGPIGASVPDISTA